MFRILAVAVAAYTAYAVLSGSVLAKSGWRMRRISRAEAPEDFWLVIVIYAGLSLAMALWF